jgi:hypothetical protein
VLYQQRAFPQQVDIAVFVTQLLDALLKGGNLAALDAKDLKELVSEAFGVRFLAFDVLPVRRERTGAVGNFFPVEGHGRVFKVSYVLARR